jgi:hypothetical protein
MPSDRTSSPADSRSDHRTGHPFALLPRWWIQVARVRLRLLLLVVGAGVFVSQWPIVRNVWERWTWGMSGRPVSGSVSTSHEYFCPMDPGVISVWPAICPICNMDLVPRKKTDAAMLPEGVIARMQLSPYRVQLAGIRTSLVEMRLLQYQQNYVGTLRRDSDDSLGFSAPIDMSDLEFFKNPRPAEVRLRDGSESVPATVRLVRDLSNPCLRFVIDDGRAFVPGAVAISTLVLPSAEVDDVLAIPESAVVDRGRERLVYVETMPGLFDGVAVELGRRCGGFYPVIKGLKSGQRIATAGAFLIDAETRLNPGLAAGYFGASQNEPKRTATTPTSAAPPGSPLTKASPPKKALSREDQALVDIQRICPVTELALDSMGGPVPVMISGRKVFICCSGCERRLKDDPDKYLARLLPR